ncbi:putative transposase like protein [Trichonephila clavipes]|nr:putative transposase like protein [Trichonephila clavipes]
MKVKCLNWAKQCRDKDVDLWRSACFIDDSTFEILQNKAQFVRRRRGAKFHSDCVVHTVKHPTKNRFSQSSAERVLDVCTWLKLGLSKLFWQNKISLCWIGRIIALIYEPNRKRLELMKREVAKDVITNETQLLQRIIHVWNHHPQIQETVQSCIDIMPLRIEPLIAAKWPR